MLNIKTVIERILLEKPDPNWEKASSKGLDMSKQARHARAKAMGYDIETVWKHGTGVSFDAFKGAVWLSHDPELATMYAGLRSNIKHDDPNGMESATLMPVYVRYNRVLNIDKVGNSPTIKSFVEELVSQSGTLTMEMAKPHIKIMIRGRREEESGPYYNKHDFWNDTTSHFGEAGARSLQTLFKMANFDAIIMTELDYDTIGILDPSNVRSVFAAFDPSNDGKNIISG